MTKTKVYKTPKCKECENILITVQETTYEKYEFNKKTGAYDEASYGELIVKCPRCCKDISDMFPEGAINFQEKRR